MPIHTLTPAPAHTLIPLLCACLCIKLSEDVLDIFAIGFSRQHFYIQEKRTYCIKKTEHFRLFIIEPFITHLDVHVYENKSMRVY